MNYASLAAASSPASTLAEPLPPETVTLIWLGIAYAAFIAAVLIGVHLAGRKKPVPVPEPQPKQQLDQDWWAYQQEER